MKKQLLPIAVSACACIANAQVLNGSFETNDYGSDDFKASSELSGGSTFFGDKDATANNWTFGSGTAGHVLKDTAGPNVATSHVSFAVGLIDNEISQKFAIAANGNYLFNVDVFIPEKDKNNEWGWDLTENGPTGPLQLFSSTGVKVNSGNEVTLSQVVSISNAGSSSYSIRLFNKDSDSDGQYTYFDNLTVTPTKVPEPSSTLLLGLSGMALAFRRNRR